MENSDWANQQREILERYHQWVQEEGGIELPVLLSTYMQPHQEARIQWLKERTEGTVLDVGCSWGYLVTRLNGQAGVDINPNLLDIGRLLAPQVEFTEADARNLYQFEDNSYDTVVIAETLEHLEWTIGVHTAIGEAKRVARKKVLVTVPAPESDEAVSFKHQWVVGPREQATLGAMLGGEQTNLPGFICYEVSL